MVFADYSDEDIAGMIHHIQLYVMPRRIRCKEFFNDYDPLRCGRVTHLAFAKAINMIGLRIPEAQVEALTEHFVENGPGVTKPQVVNYHKFIAAVDEIFSSEEDQAAMKEQMSSSPGSTCLSSFVPKTVEEEERFMHVLHRVATLCKARGVLIKGLYFDCDRNQNPSPSMLNPRRGGKVTKEQFVRNWPFKKEMTPEDIELVCERFETKTGDIHFMALHNEVSEVMIDPAQPFPTSPLHLKPDDAEWSHHGLDVVRKLQAKVVEKRTRIKEHFMDFDPLRKGLCTPGQVKAVFTIMSLGKEIDKADFESLMHRYVTDDSYGFFNYRSFCQDVDQAFTRPSLEKSPLLKVEMPDAATTACARRNTMRLSPSKLNKVGKVEDRIQAYVRKRRILIKPMFTDFDKPNRGYITRNQFSRIMSTFGPELDEKSIGLLCGVYCDQGNHNDFNYNAFLKAIDPLPEDIEVAMMEMSSPHIGFRHKNYFDSRGKTLTKSRSTPML